MLFTALANHSKTMVLLLLALAQSLQDLLPEKTGMLYLMSKNGSSLQPDTVKHISPKTAQEIQKERKILIQSMFAAKQAGRDAKVVNRSLFIDNNVFNISNIPVEYQVVPT